MFGLSRVSRAEPGPVATLVANGSVSEWQVRFLIFWSVQSGSF